MTVPGQANTEAAAEPALVFLSKKEVLRKIPITAPTLWSWVRQGRFPKPRSLGPNKTCWVASEIDAWMQAQPVRTYKP
jgi:prophage regulatory protein